MFSYLEIVLRAFAAFFVLMLVIRIQGKKQIAQFSYINYINGIAVGSLAANAVFARDVPMWEALSLIVLWAGMIWLIAFLSLKNMTMRHWFEGVSRYMIKDGHILEQNLRRENLTIEDLTSMLRQKNNFAIDDVTLAVLELNGSLSVLGKSDHQMVTRGDLHLSEKRTGIALPLVVDGVLMRDNLNANHLTATWVEERLNQRQLQMADVLYMELGIDNQIKIEKKD